MSLQPPGGHGRLSSGFQMPEKSGLPSAREARALQDRPRRFSSAALLPSDTSATARRAAATAAITTAAAASARLMRAILTPRDTKSRRTHEAILTKPDFVAFVSFVSSWLLIRRIIPRLWHAPRSPSTARRTSSTSIPTVRCSTCCATRSQLNNPRFGCGLGQCGACTVLVDNRAVRSCSLPVSRAAGQEDRHHRRARHGRASASGAAGVHRRAGVSVRLLPQRLGADGKGAARHESEADRRRRAQARARASSAAAAATRASSPPCAATLLENTAVKA